MVTSLEAKSKHCIVEQSKRKCWCDKSRAEMRMWVGSPQKSRSVRDVVWHRSNYLSGCSVMKNWKMTSCLLVWTLKIVRLRKWTLNEIVMTALCFLVYTFSVRTIKTGWGELTECVRRVNIGITWTPVLGHQLACSLFSTSAPLCGVLL